MKGKYGYDRSRNKYNSNNREVFIVTLFTRRLEYTLGHNRLKIKIQGNNNKLWQSNAWSKLDLQVHPWCPSSFPSESMRGDRG